MINPYESPAATNQPRRKFRVNRFGLALTVGVVSVIVLVGGHAFFVETMDEPGTLRAEVAKFVFLAGQVGIAVTFILLLWASLHYPDQRRRDDYEQSRR